MYVESGQFGSARRNPLGALSWSALGHKASLVRDESEVHDVIVQICLFWIETQTVDRRRWGTRLDTGE